MTADKMKVHDLKPKIRKTKEELIMENEMNYFMKRKKGPATVRSGSTGFNKTPATTDNGNTKGFYKPQLDPLRITSNKKFDEIPDPDDKSVASKLPPARPKLLKQPLRREVKEEKEITGKLTDIAIDQKTNTATTVERRIDRLHTGPKEITQKPNFARLTSNQATPQNGSPYQEQMQATNPYARMQSMGS